jgi:PHD/YefM family antitoxin component YafN of YafNO toxin-antitoxin module
MKRVTSAELMRNFGRYSDVALAEPVIVTKNGRDRLVLIGIVQYNVFQHAVDALDEARAKSAAGGSKPSRRNTVSRRGR